LAIHAKVLRAQYINPNKWEHQESHILCYLGFIWNSRTLELFWPVDKQCKLTDLIDHFVLQEMANNKMEPVLLTPADKATILGLLKHGGIVADQGDYLSIRLQQSLIDETIKVNKARKTLKFFGSVGGLAKELPSRQVHSQI
jgi:hypothetical protein